MSSRFITAIESSDVLNILECLKFEDINECDLMHGLVIAAAFNYPDSLRCLLDNGVKDDGRAVQKAAYHGNLETLKVFFENGRTVPKEHLDTELQKATNMGLLNIVEFLVEHGADIRADNDKALCEAVYFEHPDLVKFFLGNGADPNAQTGLPQILDRSLFSRPRSFAKFL